MARSHDRNDEIMPKAAEAHEARRNHLFRDNYIGSLILNRLIVTNPENVSLTLLPADYTFASLPVMPHFDAAHRNASWARFTLVPA